MSDGASAPSDCGSTLARGLAWLAALTVVGASASRLVVVVRDQLAAPFDLISEGPHLSTVQALRSGVNIYDPASYLGLPYALTPYTPPYHLLVAALPQDPTNPFFTGRVVAALCMFGGAAAILVAGRRVRDLPIAVIALALFFLIRPITGNTAYLRSDSLALIFSIWSVVALARVDPARPAAHNTRAVELAALLATLSIAGKHSLTAAAGAGFVWLLTVDARLALRFALVGIASAAVLALAAWIMWGNGFWFCTTLPISTYPRHWEGFWGHVDLMAEQPVFWCFMALAAAGLLPALARRRHEASVGLSFLYMAWAWAAQTAVMTGIGAENHNLFEPLLATALWITLTVPSRSRTAAGRLVAAGAFAVAMACIVTELQTAPWRSYSFTTRAYTADYVRKRATTERALAQLGLGGRRFLNLKNSQVTHDFPGDITVNDPFMFLMLWETRAVSTQPLLDAITARRFDAALVSPTLTSSRNQVLGRPSNDLISHLFRHYRLAFHGELVNVLTPIEPR